MSYILSLDAGTTSVRAILFDHEGRAGVQVLTYHSAKGLEWPVCICCETTKPIPGPSLGPQRQQGEGVLHPGAAGRPLDKVLALALRQPEEGR